MRRVALRCKRGRRAALQLRRAASALTRDLSEVAEESKQWEAKTTCTLERHQPWMVRLDGHRFSRFTRSFLKPYDMRIFYAMHRTSQELLWEFNPSTVYTQSDEISLVFPAMAREPSDSGRQQQELAYKGKVQKISSLVSGFASARFAHHMQQQRLDGDARKLDKSQRAFFDGRAFSVPRDYQVAENLAWRAADCRRNSINNLGFTHFSARQLQRKPPREVRRMLQERHGIRWQDCHSFYKWGALLKRVQFTKQAYNPKAERHVTVQRVRPAIASFDLMATPNSALTALLLSKNVNETPDFLADFQYADYREEVRQAFSLDSRPPALQAVIFDVDGLLLDTEVLYKEANERVCAEFGKQYSREVQLAVLGRGVNEGAQLLVEMLQLPMSGAEFLDRRRPHLEKTLPKANAMPGAYRIVRKLHKEGVPLAIGTSSSAASLRLKFTSHPELWEMLKGAVVTGDDADIKQGKPAPDIFQVAARRLGVDPAQCLVMEDAPNGLLAAKAAGMACCFVPHRAVRSSEAASAVMSQADVVLSALSDFPVYDVLQRLEGAQYKQ